MQLKNRLLEYSPISRIKFQEYRLHKFSTNIAVARVTIVPISGIPKNDIFQKTVLELPVEPRFCIRKLVISLFDICGRQTKTALIAKDIDVLN